MPALPTFELCPAGTLDTASARLRCHVLARELARLGCNVRLGLDGLPPGAPPPDVLLVQKCHSPAIVARARAVRAAGGLVIFDIDDWGDAVPWVKAQPQWLAEILALASVVSVDTTTRAEVFAKDPAYAAVPAIWVVPDPVDYVDQVPPLPAVAGEVPPLPAIAGEPQRLLAGCWFGNGPNLAPALPWVQAAVGSGRLHRFGVITNAQFVPQMQAAWPVLAVEAWALASFPERLRAHDFCLLVHDTQLEGVQKSNNKMLAALAQGVVPLVSNTPAYAETARQIGVPELIVERPDDLAARLAPGVLDALRARLALPPCRQVLDANMPASVARGLLGRVQAALGPRSPVLPIGPSAPLPASPVVPLRINLGCGDMLLPGYVNVDIAAERRGRQPDVLCDVRDLRTAFPDNHADEVLAVHVIEHFYRWEVADIVREWVRVLKPGGRLVLECPNLISACEALLANPEVAARPGQEGSRTMWCFYGDPAWQDPLMCHKWLYTPQSLAAVMREAGLTQLAQTAPWFKARHPRDMRIEGVKPLPVGVPADAQAAPQGAQPLPATATATATARAGVVLAAG